MKCVASETAETYSTRQKQLCYQAMGLLPDTQNCGMRMRWEYWEHFPATATTSQRSRQASRHVRHARAVMHVEIANPRGG